MFKILTTIWKVLFVISGLTLLYDYITNHNHSKGVRPYGKDNRNRSKL